MVKERDIIEEKDIPEDECEICYTWELSREKLKDKLDVLVLTDHMFCPYCGKELEEHDFGYCPSPSIVVGANFYNPDHNVYATRIFHCEDCNKYFMQSLEEIIWNANHCIYYTGADQFLVNDEDKKYLTDLLSEKIHENLEQYTRRIKAGDKNLDTWNIETWLKHSMTEVVANFLYRKGWKK